MVRIRHTIDEFVGYQVNLHSKMNRPSSLVLQGILMKTPNHETRSDFCIAYETKIPLLGKNDSENSAKYKMIAYNLLRPKFIKKIKILKMGKLVVFRSKDPQILLSTGVFPGRKDRDFYKKYYNNVFKNS